LDGFLFGWLGGWGFVTVNSFCFLLPMVALFGCANQHQASIAGYNCSGCARREQIDSGAAYRACTELLVQL
jgi:hypothetical protein